MSPIKTLDMLQDIKNTVLMITKNTIFRAKDPDTRLSSLISLYLTFRFNEGIISILQKELGKKFLIGIEFVRILTGRMLIFTNI